MLRCTFVLAALALCLPACGDNESGVAVDASPPDDAVVPFDASTLGDGPLPLGWVDFTVSGCASGEGSEASPCIGPSPLVLRFTALAPAEVTNQSWDFGDGSDSDLTESPEHRYEAPGSYAIALNVEGPGGTAGATRLAAVVVIPAPLAAECQSDDHCASGDCACEEDGTCSDLLSGGMCVLNCDTHAACGANLCINLDPTGIASEDWHRTTCVPACDPSADDCGATSNCQALRGVDGVLSFACFTAGLLRPIGSSCRGLDGNLANGLCASGLCLDMGERGTCSEPCDTLACPEGSACGTFTGGDPSPHCLADCEASSCDSDPGLACQQPDANFSVDETASAAGYCTPI
jgi:PKD repeat protein